MESYDDVKWDIVKKTTFQSHDARLVSGVTDVDGIFLNITILVFNGGNELSYVILVCDTKQIASLHNDEIVKSFSVVNSSASVNSSVSVGNDGKPCSGMATVTDIDKNTYNTVQIGNQCWMKENLRTTRYADGTTIPMGSTTSDTTAYRYAPDNNNSNVTKYGYLYNWPAVMHGARSSESNPSGVQGICPDDWHVPSDAEWTQLTDYVSSKSEYVYGFKERYNEREIYIAKALASTTGWESSTYTCAIGNNMTSNNATGFSALPAGDYLGFYNDFGLYATFWSATTEKLHDYFAYNRSLDYDYSDVDRNSNFKSVGFSVRCVRD